MTNEEQWELYCRCTVGGLSPNEARIVVALAEPGGKTMDELQLLMYGTKKERYDARPKDWMNLKVQLAHLRPKVLSVGIILSFRVEKRLDHLNRVKNWRRHFATVDKSWTPPPFWDWKPDWNKKKAA
jgi:hypothetical protein